MSGQLPGWARIQGDLIARLSILTAERDHLLRRLEKGDSHSRLDKQLDQILEQIAQVEGELKKEQKEQKVEATGQASEERGLVPESPSSYPLMAEVDSVPPIEESATAESKQERPAGLSVSSAFGSEANFWEEKKPTLRSRLEGSPAAEEKKARRVPVSKASVVGVQRFGLFPAPTIISPETEAYNQGRLSRFAEQVATKKWEDAQTLLTELLTELKRNLLTAPQITTFSQAVHPLLREGLPDALDGMRAPEAKLTVARQGVFDAYTAIRTAVRHKLTPADQATFYYAVGEVLLAKGYALPTGEDAEQNASAYWQAFEEQAGALASRPALRCDLATLATVGSLQAQWSLLNAVAQPTLSLYASFLRHAQGLEAAQPERAQALQLHFLAHGFPGFLTRVTEALNDWGMDLKRSASQDEKGSATARQRLESDLKQVLDPVLSSACVLQRSGRAPQSKALLERARDRLTAHLTMVKDQGERALDSAEAGPERLLAEEKRRFESVQHDLGQWRSALEDFARRLPPEVPPFVVTTLEKKALLEQIQNAWDSHDWSSLVQRYQAVFKQLAQNERQGLIAVMRPLLNTWLGAVQAAEGLLLPRHQQKIMRLVQESAQQQASGAFYQYGQELLIEKVAIFSAQLDRLEKEERLTAATGLLPTLTDTLQNESSLYPQKIQTWLLDLQHGLTVGMPMKQLLQQSTAQVQALLSLVFQAVENTLGAAPCAFAVLGLGSYAREAVLPCSDIDFALLLAQEEARDAPYFVALIRLFQLGWRCLPADILPLDEGDLKFILDGDKALLQTPEGMVEEHLPVNEPTRWVLPHYLSARHPRLIVCSQTQAEQAKALLPHYHRALAARFKEASEGRPLHQALGGVCLEHLFQRDTGEDALNAHGQGVPTVSVKERCLRPIELSSLALAVYYQLTAKVPAEDPAEQKPLSTPALEGNPYRILEALAEQKILHLAFVQDVTALLDRSQRARLRLHLAWLQQKRPPQAQQDRLLLTATAGFSPDFSVDEKALNVDQGDWQVLQPLREAASLWCRRTPTEVALDPLQARYEKVYQALQENPERARDTDLSFLAQVLAHRSRFDAPYQDQQFLDLPRGLRERYLQALSRYLPRAQAPLLRHLYTLPEPGGWRLQSHDRAQTWLHSLAPLWDPDAKAGVVVACIEHHQVVKRFLRPEMAAQFLSEGRFKSKEELKIYLKKVFNEEAPGGGNHRVYPIHLGKETAFWFKLFPEQPSTEGVVQYLDSALGCFGTPTGQLLKIYPQGAEAPGYAVYASQHSGGESLEAVLKKYPARLEKLSLTSWVTTLLRVLLTNPEDDKGDDYFLVPASKGRYTLQRIDNERAFFQPFAEAQLQVKSVLYCMDAMTRPLNQTAEGQAVLADFLRLEPLSVVGELLQALSEAQPLWQQLFSEAEALLHFEQKAPEMSLPLLMLPEGLEKELLNRLTAMQSVLRLNPQATGLDLLSSVQPKLGYHYKAVHQQFPVEVAAPHQKTLRRFLAATPKLYLKDDAGNLKSMMAGPMAFTRSMRIATEMDEAMVKAIYAGHRLSPRQAKAGFARWSKQNSDLILKGLKQQGRDEKAVQARAQAKVQFQQLPLRQKNEVIKNQLIPELEHLALENQAFILEAMTGTAWHSLPLSAFQAVLNEALLLPLLKSAGGHLVSLKISGCRGLTSDILAHIAAHCPKLKYLQMNDQNEWKSVDTRALPELVGLEMEGASQLKAVVLGDLPSLTYLSVAGAVRLETLGDSGWLSYPENFSYADLCSLVAVKGVTKIEEGPRDFLPIIKAERKQAMGRFHLNRVNTEMSIPTHNSSNVA